MCATRENSAHAVTRSTLRQQIAGALRDEVLAGRLRPGQEFTVKEIAEQYGVSATPVREAMVDLSAQGLLDSVQHRGFRVHEFSVADYRAMVEARGLIADAMFSGLGHRTPGDAGRYLAVRRRGEEAARAASAGDLNVLIGYDLRFWQELCALFGNPYLSDFAYRLRLQSWVCSVPYLRRQDDLRGRLWTGHGALIDALAHQRYPEAQAIIAAYNADSLALVEELAGPGVH
ncbi:GntR family transcriptional regulator [Streptomyces albidoflavus]|nr:GntR family transcriptional regulator [Streptomyces sp. L06]